jgi:hypothetical protein
VEELDPSVSFGFYFAGEVELDSQELFRLDCGRRHDRQALESLFVRPSFHDE